MTWLLFLDESGDLGFDFENKDCSRHLTISILVVRQQRSAKSIRGAVKKTLKRKVNHGKKGKKSPEAELKGSSTSLGVKQYFYELIRDEEFGIYAITLDKHSIQDQLQGTSNAKSELYDLMAQRVIEAIEFDPPPSATYLIVDRSKGRRGISEFNRRITTQLRKRLPKQAPLRIEHTDSKVDRGLSAADLFCWGIFRHWEHADDEWYELYRDKVLQNEKYQ